MISGSSLASIYPERWLAEGFFARHETFCPRYGWLKKGFDEVSSNSEDQIRDVVVDAAAAKAVLKESPELTHDGVARKEARFRAHAAEERLRGFLNTLFAPGNDEAAWYVMGERRNPPSHRDLSRLLSDACDQTYSKCPIIRNELINRTRLSSAAARARRELMDAMVSNEAQEMLSVG